MSGDIISERVTADIEGEFVVFRIGMRINKLWKVHKWAPVFVAMPRMLRELEADPDSGLLGGMLGWPGSDWGDAPAEDPPIHAEWRTLPTEARHTFTHFHLRLTVKTALVPMDRKPARGHFVEADAFDPSDLPTVMRKAHALTTGS